MKPASPSQVQSPFQIIHTDPLSHARAGILRTTHGVVETPVFMPVGTQASVKTLDSLEVREMGYRLILNNTYHLYLRPGREILRKAGGLHRFMSWPGAILTDSGGYQVFSLAPRCRITEDGVEFSSHLDGTKHHLTPEITTDFQLSLGSDIAMCLDDCPPYPTLDADARVSLERTLRWARRCRDYYQTWIERSARQSPLPQAGGGIEERELPAGDGEAAQWLFAISQGAGSVSLRRESSERLAEMDFPGYAVGGLGLGEPRARTWEWLQASLAPLPVDRPRYLMGFGQPEDMWEGVESGVDMFDCVLPTRNARNGQALTTRGRLNVSNSKFKEDLGPLDAACTCLACKNYSRAYLCHLFRAGEMTGAKLLTLHNLNFMLGLLRLIRRSIVEGRFQDAKKEFFASFGAEKTPRLA